MGWEVLIPALLRLGVSWATLRQAQQDTGMDDAQIEANRVKWIVLVRDIERASKPPAA